MPRRLLIVLWAVGMVVSGVVGALEAATAGVSPGAKLYVDRPGVYAVDLQRIVSLTGAPPDLPAPGLRLTCRGRVVPHWLVDEGPAGRRLLFLADSAMFRPGDVRDATPMRVVMLTWDAGQVAAPASGRSGLPGPGAPAELTTATVRRRLHLEQNVLRAAVTSGDADAVDTLWYWAMLTQQSSSQLEVDLGDLSDRATEGQLDLEVTVRLLGWSRTPAPGAESQHRVDLFLNDQKIGESAFDGRRKSSIQVEGIPASMLRDGGNRLRIKVPARAVRGSPDPLLDIVYVDWVDVRYTAGSPLASGAAPLLLGASPVPRWLPDPAGPPASRLMTAAGWTATRRREGGWVVPPCAMTEVWVVDRDDVREPIALEPRSTGARSIPADVEYVMIAPSELRAGAERLAELHRRLGQTVAVVSANAVDDEFGGGERSAAAIRRFLRWQYDRTRSLHWVLLVGDADWFEPDNRAPSLLTPGPDDRDRVPTWTYLSSFGPAASDHYYGADPQHEAVPRFAVGRLPVVDPAVLDAYVAKVEAWVGAGARPGDAVVLMLSDASKGSRLQQERMRRRLAGLPLRVVTLKDAPGPPDEAAIAALDQRPDIVYFGGHGSRYMWELGDPGDPEPASFFDRADVARLKPTTRPPIVLSMSCATAPFDHPSADSLGEVMVLNSNRGAVVFVGASAPLFTPPRFGELLVRGLLREATVGDAFVAAKRQAARVHVSHLYNLLGDPGLPLLADHPNAGAEDQ